MLNSAKHENFASLRSEFWGISCEGNKKYSQIVGRKFHITMAALDPTVKPTSPIVSLMVDRAGSQYLLCSLKPDSILQVNLNLYFDKGEEVTFSLKGHGTVHLSGYHIFNDSDKANSPIKGIMKSPVKSTLMDSTAKKSVQNASQKLMNDKQSFEISKITSTMKSALKKFELSEDSDDENDSDDDDEDESDDASSDDEDFDKTKSLPKMAVIASPSKEKSKILNSPNSKAAQLVTKRDWQDSSEDESSEVSSSDIDDSKAIGEKLNKKATQMKKVKNVLQEKKKQKKDLPMSKKSSLATYNIQEVIDVEMDVSKAVQKSTGQGKMTTPVGTPSKKNIKSTPPKADSESSDSSDSDELNSSVGRTPMPVSKTMPSIQAVNDVTGSKKKKKKKKLVNESSTGPNTPEVGSTNLANVKYSKKAQGGVEYEDLREGNGPMAKNGKLVHVYYTGKLENNTVFDSRQTGSKPFSFKLGTGQVIKGWDIGIDGMKVGGKRKIKIPPQMGYKQQKMGPIPANSTLYFVVDLKAVS